MLERIVDKVKSSFRSLVGEGRIPSPDKLYISGLKNPELVFFVVGHPKSGTTWIARILDSHPRVSCKFEGHFFYRDDYFINLSNALNTSEDLKRWASGDYNKWSEDYDEELNYFKKLIIQFYLQREAHQTGKPIIGDKTPSYQLEEMAKLFPDAKVIHIIRDGRDVTVSIAFHRASTINPYLTPEMVKELAVKLEVLGPSETPKGLPDKFVSHIANTWKKEVQTCRTQGKKLFGRNYLELKYEDLHADPESTVKRIFDHLKIRSTPDVVKTCLKKADFKVLSRGRQRGQQDSRSFFRKGIVGDWKNVFDEKNLSTFRSIAGELFAELGY